jgi:hypothetical protein
MTRNPLLSDASPVEHWREEADRLRVSIESLREQIRLADEEILRKEQADDHETKD